ncbi:MAG: transposase [Myxococcota bacterium]
MPFIPSALSALLASFRECFSRPGFDNFAVLVTGWILCAGRHTISRVLQAAGEIAREKHHSTYYRFLSRGAWAADELGGVLFRLLLRWLPQEIELQVDDTLCEKSGPHFFGAGMHHDARRSTYGRGTAAGRRACLAFGHNWVVLSVWVAGPWSRRRGWAVPLLFRLYRGKKRCPKTLYRKRTELAAEMVERIASWLPADRRLHLTGDREYACKTLVRVLPEGVVFTGPMALDAALYALPHAYRGRGRPPRKGVRLPSPQRRATDRKAPWRAIVVTLYGKPVSLRVQTWTCLWYTVAGTRRVKVVLTQDPKGQARTQAYFCTDPQRSVTRILAGYAKRWSLEVAFCHAKQTMGLENPQNGWWRRPAGRRPKKKRPGPQPKGRRGELAVRHTVPLAFAAYGLVLVWYLRHGNPQRDVARARQRAPWYRHKKHPSFTDMLAALRRRILAERISADPLPKRLRRKVLRLFPESLLAA